MDVDLHCRNTPYHLADLSKGLDIEILYSSNFAFSCVGLSLGRSVSSLQSVSLQKWIEDSISIGVFKYPKPLGFGFHGVSEDAELSTKDLVSIGVSKDIESWTQDWISMGVS